MGKKNDGNKDLKKVVQFDPETGEYKEIMQLENLEDYVIYEKEKLLQKQKHARKEQARKTDKRGPFVMGITDKIRELEATNLTITDRRYFMMLVLYAGFNGEPLRKEGVPLNNQSIAELWGLTERKTKERLSKFVRSGLLERLKNPDDRRQSNYVLNELYFRKGKMKTNEHFVKLFQNKLKEVIENIEKIEANRNRRRKKPIDIKDVVGLLHAVIPYFHFETYYLVKNPDEYITDPGEKVLDAIERKPKALKHLSKSDIGRILGYEKANRQTIDKYFNVLQQAGAVLIIKGKRTRYLIHPDLMFRLGHDGMDDYTRYVRVLFEQDDNDENTQ